MTDTDETRAGTRAETPAATGTDTPAPGSARGTGNSGTASFTATDTASGTNANVSGTLAIGTTPSSANLSGSFSSFSDSAADASADPTSTGGGTATFAFIDTASGTNANVSGTLAIGTTSSSATLSGSFSSSSDDPASADLAARSFADATKAITSGSGDKSLLKDLSSGVMGAASGSGTNADRQGGPIQQPSGSGCRIAGLHDGHGSSAMTGAPHHQFST
ncbi:MAG TPA: hypothetical protein VJ779_10325 [Acetobacteraceae bacterium]|nr:hypothetical protein [Acetobacteraceae bacterium]